MARRLKEHLHVTRELNGRLYFVSDESIVRAMNDHGHIKNILKEVFNIGEVIETEDSILGIRSEDASEAILFSKPVPLLGPVNEVVAEFEFAMKNTLEMYFYDKAQPFRKGEQTMNPMDKKEGCDVPRGRISVLDELIQEHAFFSSQAAVDPPSHKLQTLMRLASKHPDILALYPKPNIQNAALHAGKIRYMFEYYPPTPFIFTSLTSRVFSSIVLYLHRPGILVYGPSGIGKTETVKYFCRTIGAPLYTFCCSENVKYASLENIIVGCARLGCYICFDEFNRLSKEVMSSVTECIYRHKDVIKIFLTMNLGCRGRHELPRSLRAIFGEVRAERPDIKDIVQYYTGSVLLFEMLGEMALRCSVQPHYDFGLRAINSILGARRRHLLEGDARLHSKAIQENLIAFYMASLLNKDKPILADLLEKYYSTSINLAQYTPAMLFEHGIAKNTGVILCGREGMRLLKPYKNTKVYNPLNLLLTNHGIFGHLDSNKEWRDSLFLRDLRAAEKATWFVFDGPIFSEWIEDFNSALDDNKTICLTTGERMKVDPRHRFIFVCDSLMNATLATLTRVFILFLEDRGEACDMQQSAISRICDGLQSMSIDACKLQEISIENSEPFRNCLPNKNIFFIFSKAGAGKKSIAKSIADPLIMNARSWSLDAFKDNAKKMIYVENFEKADVALQEMVREFSIYGRIGELKTRNIKMICGIDSPLRHSCLAEELDSYIPALDAYAFASSLSAALFYVGDPDLSLLIESHYRMVVPPRFYSLIAFIHDYWKLSRNCILKYLGLVEPEKPAYYLYFVIRILFGEASAVTQFFESAYGEKLDSKIIFDPEILKFCESTAEITLSKLTFLLHSARINTIILQGGRLCGKKWLCNKAISCAKSENVRIVSWVDTEPASVNGDALTVYLTVEDLCKSIAENAAKITMEERPYEISPSDYLESLERSKNEDTSSLHSEENTNRKLAVESASFAPYKTQHSRTLISIEQRYSHPKSCIHFRLSFDSFYKLSDFKKSVDYLHEKLRKKTEARQRFLRDGIERIEVFKRESCTLKEEIIGKNKCLREKIRVIDELLVQVAGEQETMERETGEVSTKKKWLEAEIARSNEKRMLVSAKLKGVEPLLTASKEALSKINKGHLSEIKVMSSPPLIIKGTIEFVYYLLEKKKKSDWKELLFYIKRDDFISKVMNYLDGAMASEISADDSPGATGDSSLSMDDSVIREFFEKNSLEKAVKASHACGALFQWAKACIEYIIVSREVVPLKEEIKLLEMSIEQRSAGLVAEEEALDKLISGLAAKRRQHAELSEELLRAKDEISTKERKMHLLDRAIDKLKDEAENWMYLEYECPVNEVMNHIFNSMFESRKNIFVSTVEDLEDVIAKNSQNCKFVRISLNDRNSRKALVNAIVYNTAVAIEDVDRFDPHVYSLLRRQIEGIQAQPVIVQGAYANFYKMETYEYKRKVSFGTTENSRLNEAEERLLYLLHEGSDPGAICSQKDLLDAERRREQQGQSLEMYSKRMASYYECLSSHFKSTSRLSVI